MSDWLTRSAEEEIDYDVDVLFGAWPSHHVDADLGTVRARLKKAGVRHALIASTRGALLDAGEGNRATLDVTAAESDGMVVAGLLPVVTVDLRDVLDAERRLDDAGTKWLRLFTVQQGVQQPTPGYLHVVKAAVARGMVVLQDGDPRKFGPALMGLGAQVVFLDLHVYLLTDFLVMAKQEPGFRATTRMMSSPDGIERVVGTVGAEHLVFGSRTPFMDISPQTLRLRYAQISPAERALVAGGNVRSML